MRGAWWWGIRHCTVMGFTHLTVTDVPPSRVLPVSLTRGLHNGGCCATTWRIWKFLDNSSFTSLESSPLTRDLSRGTSLVMALWKRWTKEEMASSFGSDEFAMFAAIFRLIDLAVTLSFMSELHKSLCMRVYYSLAVWWFKPILSAGLRVSFTFIRRFTVKKLSCGSGKS